jgi:hypothetical protein
MQKKKIGNKRMIYMKSKQLESYDDCVCGILKNKDIFTIILEFVHFPEYVKLYAIFGPNNIMLIPSICDEQYMKTLLHAYDTQSCLQHSQKLILTAGNPESIRRMQVFSFSSVKLAIELRLWNAFEYIICHLPNATQEMYGILYHYITQRDDAALLQILHNNKSMFFQQ